MMTWSRISRRTLPTNRSAAPFCQGDWHEQNAVALCDGRLGILSFENIDLLAQSDIFENKIGSRTEDNAEKSEDKDRFEYMHKATDYNILLSAEVKWIPNSKFDL
jgi:hypothetical protein